MFAYKHKSSDMSSVSYKQFSAIFITVLLKASLDSNKQLANQLLNFVAE